MLSGRSRDIELVVGPYRGGKTRRLIDEILALKRASPLASVTVIVPSHRVRLTFEECIGERLRQDHKEGAGPAGVFGLRIMHFDQACLAVLEEAGHSGRVLPDRLRAEIVGSVLDDLHVEGQLKSLASIYSLPGTARAVLELIDEFERAAASPASVLASLRQAASAGSRYLELANVYQRYWQALRETGYLDRRQLAFEARNCLVRGDLAAARPGLLAVEGFDRFSCLQLEFIEALASLCRQAKVLFDFPAHLDSCPAEYCWKESSWRLLKKILRPEKTTICQPGDRHKALEISRFSALDRFEEMREVARQARQLLMDRKALPSEILVVVRDIKPYREPVRAAFTEARLPYFVDDSLNLVELPFARLLLRLMKLHPNDFPRRDVIACLRSPFLRQDVVGLDPCDVDRLDRLSWEHSLVAGQMRWEQTTAGEEHLQAALSAFFRLVRPPADRAFVREFLIWLENLIESLLEWTETHSSDDYDPALALGQIRLIVRDMLASGSLPKAAPISYETFCRRFEDALKSTGYPNPRRSRSWGDATDGGSLHFITVCGAELAPGRSFDYVFIAGAVEGEFPASPLRLGLVSGEEMLAWRLLGVELDNPRFHPGFEEALFQEVRALARQTVCISFPRYDMKGEELTPHLLSDSQDQGEAFSRIEPYAQALERPLSLADLAGGLLWHGRELAEIDEFDRALIACDLKQAVAAGRQRMAELESALNGYLCAAVGKGQIDVPAPETWSASALSDYALCPFRYWATRILKLKPRDEATAGLNGRLAGQLYHKALELFYKQVACHRLALEPREAAQLHLMLKAATEEAFSRLASEEDFTPGEFWESEKQEIHLRLKRFLQSEIARFEKEGGRFSVFSCEAKFGFNDHDSYPELVIAAAGGKVRLRGQIDRLDSASGEAGDKGGIFRVIDYKASTASISARDVEQGRNLQLPLYMLAVEQSIAPGGRATSACYLSVLTGQPTGRIEGSSAEIQEALDKAVAKVGQIVAGVKAGRFTLSPSKPGLCKTCPQVRICRIREQVQAQGKTDESRAQSARRKVPAQESVDERGKSGRGDAGAEGAITNE